MATADEDTGERGLDLGRVLALSDGVFAIALTLLVLDLAVPHLNPDRAGSTLARALLNDWGHDLAYVLSFYVIGLYWRGHRRMFRHILRSDERLIALNLLLLLLVAYLPYPTAVLAAYGDTQPAVVFYAASVAATSFASWLLWWYASAGHRLVAEDLDRREVRRGSFSALVPVAVFSISIALSFLSTPAAYWTWGLGQWAGQWAANRWLDA